MNIRVRLLNLASALFAFFLFFPIECGLIIFIPMIFRGEWRFLTAAVAFGGFGALWADSLVAQTVAHLIDRNGKCPPLHRRIILIAMGVALGIGCGFLLARVCPMTETVIWSVLAVAAWIVGGEQAFTSYADQIHFRQYFFTVGAALFTLILLRLIKYRPLPAMWFAGCLLIQTVILLFGLNQSSMDNMMRRRQHRAEQLPQKIRGYNLRLIALVAGLLIALLIFYRPVAAGLAAFGRGFRAALGALIRFIQHLTADSSTEIPPTPVGGASRAPQTEGLPSADGNSLWDSVGFLLVVLIGGYILYRAKDIFRFVKNKVGFWMGKLIALLSRRSETAPNTEGGEFADTEEHLSVAEALPDPHEPAWNPWRRTYRKYSAMAPSAERVRMGYRLVLRWLKMQKVPFNPACTPLEIAAVARKTVELPDPLPATEQYHRARYGDGTESDALDALLAELARTKTASRVSRLSVLSAERDSK